ncbi:MAG: hypothetical protein RIG77_21955 [Cyclobacteriaceae bacterium]
MVIDFSAVWLPSFGRSIGDVTLYNGRCKASELAEFIYTDELVRFFGKLIPDLI